ncbi:MAG: UDP-N-acetylmuramate--L-alanine ligase [Nitriliruptoraceae bacterium]
MTGAVFTPGSPVHLVGIGGAGMSGIARILLQRGERVTGSDLRDSRALEELRMLGATVFIGHDAEHVANSELVVTSSAVAPDNPELVAAQQRQLPVIRRAEMLHQLMRDDESILISGTHGKTTTTSMTVVALQAGGLDPSFAIGGSLNERGTNAHAGTDPIFVAESDESDRSFLVFEPDLAVVTNIELDHPDEFRDLDEVIEVFETFLHRRTDNGSAVVCSDDPVVARVAEQIAGRVLRYGSGPQADVRVVTDGERCRVRHQGRDVAEFTLRVPGHHNVLNATAAVAVCLAIDVDPADAAAGLERFTGVARRFQVLGSAANITVVDDYAHHPTELRATLAAARTQASHRVVTIVQPHRYSRTAALGAELGRAAAAADVVVVTDVYASSEAPIPGVSGQLVADAAKNAGANVVYVPHLADVADEVVALLQPGDLVVVTGAGDVTQIGPALLDRLSV